MLIPIQPVHWVH